MDGFYRNYKIYDSLTTFSALKFLILSLQKQNIMDTLSQFKNELKLNIRPPENSLKLILKKK
jgi:hypothetical protein